MLSLLSQVRDVPALLILNGPHAKQILSAPERSFRAYHRGVQAEQRLFYQKLAVIRLLPVLVLPIPIGPHANLTAPEAGHHYQACLLDALAERPY
jgi:hypothetical protein